MKNKQSTLGQQQQMSSQMSKTKTTTCLFVSPPYRKIRFHSQKVSKAIQLSSGEIVTTGGWNDDFQLWSNDMEECLFHFNTHCYVNSIIELSPREILYCSGGRMFIWTPHPEDHTATHQPFQQPDDKYRLFQLVLLPNQQLVAGMDGEKSRIYTWNVNDKMLVQTLENSYIRTDSFLVGLKDGRLVCGTFEGFLMEWSYSSEYGHQKLRFVVPSIRRTITCMIVLQNGLVATGTSEWTSNYSDPKLGMASVRVWDLNKDTMVELYGHKDEINSMVEMKDGVILSLSSDYRDSFRMWDFNTGRSQSVLISDANRRLIVLQDGSIMYFLDNDGYMYFSKTFRSVSDLTDLFRSHSRSLFLSDISPLSHKK